MSIKLLPTRPARNKFRARVPDGRSHSCEVAKIMERCPRVTGIWQGVVWNRAVSTILGNDVFWTVSCGDVSHGRHCRGLDLYGHQFFLGGICLDDRDAACCAGRLLRARRAADLQPRTRCDRIQSTLSRRCIATVSGFEAGHSGSLKRPIHSLCAQELKGRNQC